MGEGIWYDVALGLALQAIVPNGRSRLQCRFNVTRFNEIPLCLSTVRPYAGKAVRLQLDADLQRIRIGLLHAVLGLPDLGQYTKLVLDVMTISWAIT